MKPTDGGVEAEGGGGNGGGVVHGPDPREAIKGAGRVEHHTRRQHTGIYVCTSGGNVYALVVQKDLDLGIFGLEYVRCVFAFACNLNCWPW